MKLVTIKRATTDGLVECTGELYEYGGFQFCLTYNIDNGVYYAIEISTGLSARKVYSFEYESCQQCIRSLKRWIINNNHLFKVETFERSKELLSVYKYDYPLNNKI